MAPAVGPAVAELLTPMLNVSLVPAVNAPVWLFVIERSGKLIVVESLPETAEDMPPPDTFT